MLLVTLRGTAVLRDPIDQIQAPSPSASLSNFKMPPRCGVPHAGGGDEGGDP